MKWYRSISRKPKTRCLQALGLADWTPPEPLSYTARASSAIAAERMDARFFAPRIQVLLDILNRDGRVVGDVAVHQAAEIQADDCNDVSLYRDRRYRRCGCSPGSTTG